ncbi:MAG: glycoside hydrolase family 3 C-terminal domain-containing protein [Clostridia bacterium]|nr:glycoside hydrolase family 3 C-terminal domain-containing protein [Clostridia bacterium]
MDRKEARALAEKLVAQMTLEEAAGQLSFRAPAIERLGIPSYDWWNEALHGVARAGMATMFPQAIGMAATFDPELIEQLGDVAATEGRAKYNAASRHGDTDIYKGLTFWSPNINIFRDPRWGRGQETFGEDPMLTGEMGAAYVRGLQGDGPVMKASACAKHFAVHSGPEDLRHEFDAKASAKDMAETYLPAFEKLVREAKVESVMGAYNRTNGEPCCASSALMDFLRNQWGFEGHFVSDCWAIRDFHEGHHVTENAVESAAMAINAGCDLNCGCSYEKLVTAVRVGLADESKVRESAVRLFTTRYMLGILGEGSEYDNIPYTVVECDEHLEAAEKAAREACVLLKNDGMLPLDMDKIRTLGVIGPNADSISSLIGNYHGTSSRYITVQTGIQDALEGKARVLCSVGCHLYKDRVDGLSACRDDRLAEALTVAENSDAVILVVGLDETLEGEQGDTSNPYGSADKRDLFLPESQRRMMDAVLAVGKPTTIVLLAGSAIDLGEAGEKADAVLLGWYPGARGGKAIADLLLGKASPSGKLPVTFYRNEQLAGMPEFTDYSMKGRTYRYFAHEVLYPFGYGLTYGDASVCSAVLEQKDGKPVVRIEAENAGDMDTDEVVEIYVQNEGSSFAPLNPRLCAFKRIRIPAHGTWTGTVPVDPRHFLVVDEDGHRTQDGKVVLYAGMGQPDARTAALTGHKAVPVKTM